MCFGLDGGKRITYPWAIGLLYHCRIVFFSVCSVCQLGFSQVCLCVGLCVCVFVCVCVCICVCGWLCCVSEWGSVFSRYSVVVTIHIIWILIDGVFFEVDNFVN